MKTLIHTSQIPSLKEKKEVFPYHKTAYGVTILFLIILSTATFPLKVQADIGQTSGHTDQFQYFAYTTTPYPVQTIGTGLTGTLTSMYLALDGVGASHVVTAELFECDNLTDAMGATGTCVSKTTFTSGTVPANGAVSIYNLTGSSYTVDPTKYYSFKIRNTSDFNATWLYGSITADAYTYQTTRGGSSFGTDWLAADYTTHPVYAYFQAIGISATPSDTSTHIVDLLPHEGDQVGSAASTSAQLVTFSLHAYINPDDVGFFIGIDVTLENLDRNVAILNVIGTSVSPNTTVFLDHVVATSTGDFYYTVQKFVPNGTYTVHAVLTKALKDLYGNSLFTNPFHVDDVSHNFIVAMQTSQGALYTNLYNSLNDISSSTTATTTQASARTCNPISGYFDILSCGQFLFTPNALSLKDIDSSFKKNLLSYAPWGYVTRFVSIMASTTAIEPVPISYTFGSSSPSVLQGKTYTINIFDEQNLNKVSTIYTDDGQHKNIWDIVNPYFNMVVNVAILLMILSDILGFDYGIFKSKDPWSKSETQSTTIGIDRNHKRYDTSARTVSRRRKLP